MGVDLRAGGVIDRIALRRRDGAAQADREVRAAAGCAEEIRVADAGQGIVDRQAGMHIGSLVDDLQQVVEVGSGLDQQSLLAPAVRPGRGDKFFRVHRLGGDDRGVGERIGDLVVGLAVQRVAVDGPGSVRIGDLCLPVRDVGVFRVAVDRVGMEADLPAGLHLIILREDRRGHGQPVVVGDHIVQKAERERQHQRLRPVIDRKVDADRVVLPVLLDRSDLVLRDRGVGRERRDPDRVFFDILLGHRQRDGQIRRIFVQISGFQPDKPGHGAVRIVADTVKNIIAQAMEKQC